MKHLTVAVLMVLFPTLAIAEPSGTDSFSFSACLVQMFASLFVIVGAIYLVSYLSRRWLSGSGGGQGFRKYIRIVEARHLAPKKSLVLVEVAGEYLLLSNSNDGLRLVKQIDMVEEIDVMAPVGPTMSLDDRLRGKFEELMTRVTLPQFLSAHSRSER